ncbi:MAG: hypothetical protein LC689_06190 [Myxococcales bacterium]|nr:hypothetical protein [Myxococcales bacterium]
MTPALAVAWEFRQRNRWALAAIAAYLVALGTIRLLIRAAPVDVERSMSMWFLVLAPLTAAFIFLLAVFSFGLDGDFAARESIYPKRLFTLPVTTASLAGWPMLYGAVAVASLWLVTALLALWPSGNHVPLIWPALLAAVFLAWIQAITWMPYGIKGLRMVILLLWLGAAEAVVMLAMHYRVAESVMASFLLPQLPIAYVAARFAVARARRGEVPDWLGARAGRATDLPVFASPARAQLWFEWRRHGWSLPVLVGIVLPFELALLFIPDGPRGLVVLGVLFTPTFMALFTAATVRQANLTPFIATRPLNSVALTAAKLKMTIGSTLAAWVLVVVAVPLALTLSDAWPALVKPARRVVDVFGTPRAAVLFVLVLAGLLASTWKQLVQTLYIGLTGREWVVKASAASGLAVLCVIGPIAKWLHDSWGARAALWSALPWIAAVLVCVKTFAAAWVATRLHRSRLLSDRALVTGAAGWLAAVLALHGLLIWLVWAPLIPRYFLLLVAILAVPLARMSAAPLALAWNRHR